MNDKLKKCTLKLKYERKMNEKTKKEEKQSLEGLFLNS